MAIHGRIAQTRPKGKKVSLVIIPCALLAILLAGCGASKQPTLGVATTPSATPTLTPTATPITCEGIPSPLQSPIPLPAGTVITATPGAHQDENLNLCTPYTTQASIDNTLLTELQQDGWHQYDPTHDPKVGCAPITLQWVKGTTAMSWYDDSAYLPLWSLSFCNTLGKTS